MSDVVDLRARQMAALEHLASTRWAAFIAIVRYRLNPTVQQREAPSDVVQSAFRTVARRISRGDLNSADSASIEAFLTTVLTRRCASRAKKHIAQRRDVRVGEASFEITEQLAREPMQAIEADAHEIGRRIRRLPGDVQTILSLDLEGYTNNEIAERVALSLAHMKRKLTAGQRQLRLSFSYCPDASCLADVVITSRRCEACGQVWSASESDAAQRLADK